MYFKSKKNLYLDKIFTNRSGYKFKIVSYNSKDFKYGIAFHLNESSNDFDENYVRYYKTTDIKRGRIKTYYKDDYDISLNKDQANENGYIEMIWRNMIYRSKDSHIKSYTKLESYKNVTVCDEWKSLNNFLKWYTNEKESIPGYNHTFMLDKDATQYNLLNSDRIYGPKYCILIPTKINTHLTIKVQKDSTLPTGIRRRNKRYVVRFNRDEVGFNDMIEAFIFYKFMKEERLRILVKHYSKLGFLNQRSRKVLNKWKAIDYNNILTHEDLKSWVLEKYNYDYKTYINRILKPRYNKYLEKFKSLL